MAIETVKRPLWRRFLPRFVDRAAAHVRRGGLAAVVRPDGALDLYLGLGQGGEPRQLALWALLSIEHARWKRVRAGPAAGLGTSRVTAELVPSVLDWCERDATHPGATRTLALDCVTCAACCHDADVVLDEDDLEAWHRAGRGGLAGKRYVRRARDGRLTLRFAETGRCQHLAKDRRCRIYPYRPFNCRAFVAGSEACLAAREETLGWRDG